jgi:DNA-binding HxlR family transcriptional regulator
MARRAYHRFCPLSMALEDVGDRWTLHVVYALLDGPKRYADLQAFLRGAGSNVLTDRLKRLAEAGIIGRSTGVTPGSDTTYHLTERGRGLAPVIQGLVAWGFASLVPSDDDGEPETFDQTWAVPDADAVIDETYQWSLDGVEFELSVSGRSLTRTLGPARKPIVTLSMSRAALDSVLGGSKTIAEAAAAQEVTLTGPRDAIRRMFLITGFPAALHGLEDGGAGLAKNQAPARPSS